MQICPNITPRVVVATGESTAMTKRPTSYSTCSPPFTFTWNEDLPLIRGCSPEIHSRGALHVDAPSNKQRSELTFQVVEGDFTLSSFALTRPKDTYKVCLYSTANAGPEAVRKPCGFLTVSISNVLQGSFLLAISNGKLFLPYALDCDDTI
jgi:hypothetical protein